MTKTKHHNWSGGAWYRCLYEANQWDSAMSMVDDEIRKAKGEP